MTILVGVVTQDAPLVGVLAALAIMTFLVIAYLLLVVSTGRYGVPIRTREADPAIGWVRAIRGARAASAPAPIDESDLKRRLRVAPDTSQAVENYAATWAPSLRPVAESVVRRAELRGGERVLDVGTRTGIGAAAAISPGRAVVGVDSDADMLAIARRDVPAAHFMDAGFRDLPFPAAWFHALISVHALHLADEPVKVLEEWRRVTMPGGTLSLSVPGPRAALPLAAFRPVYRRHGITREVTVATVRRLSAWARAAGWQEVQIDADPTTVIRLAGPESFAQWLRTGVPADGGSGPSLEPSASLERELLAVSPTTPTGQLRIPFGTLYLTARNVRAG